MGGWAAFAQLGGQVIDAGTDIGLGIYNQNQARAEAAKNRAFQHSMYVDQNKNRYQYMVDSMRAAGLNPILAANGGFGGGSGVPGGSAANLPPIKASTSARDTMRQLAEISLLEEQATKTKAEGYKTDIDAANAIKYGKLLDEELFSAKNQAERARQEEEFLKTPAGELIRKFGVIGREINPFAGAANSARGALGM